MPALAGSGFRLTCTSTAIVHQMIPSMISYSVPRRHNQMNQGSSAVLVQALRVSGI